MSSDQQGNTELWAALADAATEIALLRAALRDIRDGSEPWAVRRAMEALNE